MIACEGYATKHVAVVGLGKSGLAAARALCRSGARVLAWDDGEDARAEAEAEGIPVRDPARIRWAAMDALVLSPGIPHTFPQPHAAARLAKDAGVPIIGDAELLATSGAQAPMVAITGTNGKSTTTALVGHILEQAGRDVEVGGNLGPAICDMAMMEQDSAYVLELSSYQLELCPSARFKVAVLLNISPDHLDRHGGLGGYTRAKKNIFRGQGSGDVSVVGVDDDASRAIYQELKAQNGRKIIPISCESITPGGVYILGETLIDDLQNEAVKVMDVTELAHLPGRHNAQNIAAAYATARMMNVTVDAIVKGIESFPGLAHRQERLGQLNGVTFVNDSKATNAEATAKALECYDNIYWIAGGLAKEGGIEELEPLMSAVRGAFLIGDAAEAFADFLNDKVKVEMCGDLQTATETAYAAAETDDLEDATVLLSPACASFDQFKCFEERGDIFRIIYKGMLAAQDNADTANRGAASA